MAATQAQFDAYLKVTRVIADTIRDLGEVPSGHLYARLMDKMSLDTYQNIIGILKRSGLVTERGHVLHWKGPSPKGNAAIGF